MLRITIITIVLGTSLAAHAATPTADAFHFTPIGSHVAENGSAVTEYRVTSAGKVWHTCETAEGFEVDCRTGREP